MLAAALFAAACGQAGPDGRDRTPEPTVRDSAGVAIVENHAARFGGDAAWALAPAPRFDLGRLEGPAATQFFQIGDGALLPDGGFVIAGFGSYDLRRFDAAGGHVWTAGREGDGPGEFEGLTAVAAGPAGSVLTYDFRLRRLSRWSAEGTHLEDRSLEGAEGAGFPFVEALLADGRAVYTWRTFGVNGLPPEGEVRRDTLEVRVATPGNREPVVIGRFPGPEIVIMRQSETAAGFRVISGSAPFARATHVAAGPDVVWVGDGAVPVVRRYGLDGTLQAIVRLPFPEAPVTDEIVRRALDAELEEADDPEERDLARQRWEDLPLPGSLPFFEELTTDARGNLWIRAFQAPGDERRRWHVLAPDGAWLTSLDLPDRYGPLEIGDDVMLARYLDGLDVEHVELREILRP